MAKLVLALVCAGMIAGNWWLGRPAGAVSVEEVAPPSARRLRIVSWNVGQADVIADSRARSEDLDAAARVIAAQHPDVVALQELTGAAQLEQVRAALGEEWRAHLAEGGRTDRFAAVLVRGEAGFSDVPCAGRLAARAELPDGTHVVSVHAPAYSSLGRRRYVDALTAALDGQPRVIVAGDLNLDVRPVADANTFSDDAKRDGEAYSALLRGLRDLGRAAGPTAAGGRRIDYVLGPRESRLQSVRTVPASIGRMDHQPLVVEVALP